MSSDIGCASVVSRDDQRPDALLAGSVVMETLTDDQRIEGWLDVWSSATVNGQTDAAVEAAEELDWLLRKPVSLP